MTRLLVLWILSERQAHGYEIKKALADDATRFWFSIDDASIYSALRTLTKQGHAREVGVEQEGNRPKRTRYAITPQGRKHYRSLLLEALARPSLPVATIDVALAARGDLSPTDVGQALAERAKALSELAEQIETNAAGAPARAIADRNHTLIEAERTWLDQLDQSTIT